MLLSEVLADIAGIKVTGNQQIRIRGISYDSRAVGEDYLFVGIRGEKSDGALFARQAVERGARVVAAEQQLDLGPDIATIKVDDARRFLALASRSFFGDPASKLKLVAITGTNGKTTTSYLVNAIYRQQRLRSCLAGTIGMKLGDEEFPSAHTTPESSDLLAFLYQAVTGGCTHGVLEASSHALSLKRVFGMKASAAVFTNLTPEHLDFHKDMESYYCAKRQLFSPEGENRIESAVLNVDDMYGKRLAGEITQAAVLTYGFGAGAQIRCTHSNTQIHGTELRIKTPQGEVEINSRLVGRPNTYNIMAALGAALTLGFDLNMARLGIESLRQIPGRMELIAAGQPFTVVVDYAHTPDALEKLLETVGRLPHRRIITVFGCGGDRDRQKRPIMGKAAGRLSDYVIATSDNPRSEDPLEILAEIAAGLNNGQAPYVLIPERRDAIAAAVKMAQPGDTVVIAGKGHEAYQIVGTRVFPFDDRETARDLIVQLSDSSVRE